MSSRHSNAMPTETVWFVEANKPGEWEPLLKTDSDNIEEAYLNDKLNEPILIDGKFYVVNIGARILTYAYSDEIPAKRLIRGTWFYYDHLSTKLTPFNEALASQIDSWFEEQKLQAQLHYALITEPSSFKAEIDFHVAWEDSDTYRNLQSTKSSISSEEGYNFKFELSCEPGTYKAPAREEDIIVEAIPLDEYEENNGIDIERESQMSQTSHNSRRLHKRTEVTIDSAGCDVATILDCSRGRAMGTLPLSNTSPSWSRRYLLEGGYYMTMTAQSDRYSHSPCIPIPIQKGFALAARSDEKYRSLDVDHLFLVIHGIGEKMFNKSPSGGAVKSFKESVDSIRKLALEQRMAVDKEAGVKTSTRMEFLCIEWYSCVHSDELNLSRDLELVTLPGIKVLRDIANEILIDIVVYLTPGFRERIITHIVRQLNKIYTLFCEYNPSFVASGGKCSLLGHSLGTVILFDILSLQKLVPPPGSSSSSRHASTTAELDDDDDNFQLNFRPRAFLAMGSPISFFISIRRNAHLHEKCEDTGFGPGNLKAHFGPSYMLPTCPNFFNLFHPHDPCAYRIEPMLYVSLKDFPPALIAHHDGNLRINYKMKSLTSKLADAWDKLINPSNWFSEEKVLEKSMKNVVINDEQEFLRNQKSYPLGCPEILLNNHKRVDYVLQETIIEGGNEYLSSLTGHTSYFDLPDVARFIVVHVSTC